MRKVKREDLLPLAQYNIERESYRQKVMALKQDRRVHVGPYLTFLFENLETVRYQIQEMIRAENTQGEKEIQHEIDTYNELIGEKGELGCTLLIEIDDPKKRPELLSRWLDLPSTLYIKTAQGNKVSAIFDPRQIGEKRISSVHYLKFRLGDQVPVAVGCSHPDFNLETQLSPAQSAALCKDLISS